MGRRPHGLAVRTEASHASIPGSIPGGVTNQFGHSHPGLPSDAKHSFSLGFSRVKDQTVRAGNRPIRPIWRAASPVEMMRVDGNAAGKKGTSFVEGKVRATG